MTISVLSEDSSFIALCQKVATQTGVSCVAVDETPFGSFPGVLIVDVESEWDAASLEPACGSVTIAVIHLDLVTRISTLLSKRGVIPLPKPVAEEALQAAITVALNICRRYGQPGGEGGAPSIESLMQVVAQLSANDAVTSKAVAMTVHDLRTPLMAAMGYCQALLRGSSSSLAYQQVESLEQLEYCLSKVDRLVADLGHLSQGRTEGMAPRRRKADIESCLKRSLAPVIPLAADKQILIRYHVQPPAGALYFQPDQIERVLINVLENGCKFSPRGGSIHVSAGPVYDPRLSDSSPENGDSFDERPNAYRVEVRDSGPGVPHQYLASIFDAAFIVDRADDRSGTGLGLAISRSIIEAHDGRIWAESQEQGLAVSFVLPMHRRNAAPRRLAGKLAPLSAVGPVPLAS